MKTFKFTVPESSHEENAPLLKGVYWPYVNAVICLILAVPYVIFCSFGSFGYALFYMLGMLWLVLVSPLLVLLQSILAVKCFFNQNKRWQVHAKCLAVILLSYVLFGYGLFVNNCAVSV